MQEHILRSPAHKKCRRDIDLANMTCYEGQYRARNPKRSRTRNKKGSKVGAIDVRTLNRMTKKEKQIRQNQINILKLNEYKRSFYKQKYLKKPSNRSLPMINQTFLVSSSPTTSLMEKIKRK